jgi:hypothetical protein
MSGEHVMTAEVVRKSEEKGPLGRSRGRQRLIFNIHVR